MQRGRFRGHMSFGLNCYDSGDDDGGGGVGYEEAG